MDVGIFQQDKCQSVMRGSKMASAFSHMVIENIFISEFRKSDLYYIITIYLRNIGYYRATKFRFKIIRAERLTRKRAPQAARFPRFRGTGLNVGLSQGAA